MGQREASPLRTRAKFAETKTSCPAKDGHGSQGKAAKSGSGKNPTTQKLGVSFLSVEPPN